MGAEGAAGDRVGARPTPGSPKPQAHLRCVRRQQGKHRAGVARGPAVVAWQQQRGLGRGGAVVQQQAQRVDAAALDGGAQRGRRDPHSCRKQRVQLGCAAGACRAFQTAVQLACEVGSQGAGSVPPRARWRRLDRRRQLHQALQHAFLACFAACAAVVHAGCCHGVLSQALVVSRQAPGDRWQRRSTAAERGRVAHLRRRHDKHADQIKAARHGAVVGTLPQLLQHGVLQGKAIQEQQPAGVHQAAAGGGRVAGRQRLGQRGGQLLHQATQGFLRQPGSSSADSRLVPRKQACQQRGLQLQGRRHAARRRSSRLKVNSIASGAIGARLSRGHRQPPAGRRRTVPGRRRRPSLKPCA